MAAPVDLISASPDVIAQEGAERRRQLPRRKTWRPASELAVDLGTANTLVLVKGEGVVLNEPSVAAVDQYTGNIMGIGLEATLSTAKMREAGMDPHRLSQGEAAAAMYWSAAQIVAHHSSNGCNLQPGDLIGTGTLSTAEETGLGSLLEISKGGKEPIGLPSGETRSFLEDGDELCLSARCEADGAVPIGFGSCVGRVLPARE